MVAVHGVRGVHGGRAGRIRVDGHGGQVESDATAADQAEIVPFVGHETVGGEDASISALPYLLLVGGPISPAVSALTACSPTCRSSVGDL